MGVVDTEAFFNKGRAYYLDLKKSVNSEYYLRLARCDKNENETYKRQDIVIFEEDIAFFVEAMSMLLSRYSAGQVGASA